MHLIAADVWPVLKVGLSVCRVIDFKQRYVQISLLKLFALIFYTRARLELVWRFTAKGSRAQSEARLNPGT